MKSSSDNRIALITGASHGIGMAVALGLANEGFDLILIARRQRQLKEVAKRIERKGRRAFIYAFDLGNQQALSSCISEISRRFKRLDLLWNGAFGWVDGPLENINSERLNAFFDSSVRATIVLTRGMLPLLLHTESPCIMNVCADWEFPENEGLSAFIAAKRAIAGFGVALAREKAGRVRVTNIHPADVASVDYDIEDDPDSIACIVKGTKIPLREFVDIVIFIVKLKHTIIHQIDIKPIRQEIAMTFLA